MFCKNCGTQLDETQTVCPNCGAQATPAETPAPAAAPQAPAPEPVAAESNTLAIVGFIFSFLFALVGLICSIIGFNRSKEMGGSGRGLAIAGIVIAAVNMFLGLILSIIYVPILLAALSGAAA